MKVRNSGNSLSWRLIYTDGGEVVGLFESTGITTTTHNMFEAGTRDDCIAEIDRLQLSMMESDQQI